MRVAFFDAKSYDESSFKEHGASRDSTHEFSFFPERLNVRTVGQAGGCDAVCIFVNDVADAAVVDALANLKVKLILLRCAGYNNVDLEAAKLHDIKVMRVPAYSPHAVAEHAVALLMTLNRRVHKAYNRVREQDFRLEGLCGFDIHGKTIGVVGTGRIGAIFATIMHGFGANILAYDVVHNEDLGEKLGSQFAYVDLDTVFAQSHVISLHVPLLPSTRHMVNADTLARMQKGTVLVNTSRGALMHTRAVIDALKAGQLGGLAVDVYEEEKALFFQDHTCDVIQDDVWARLVSFPNVLVTGHQAYFTREACDAIARVTLDNADAFTQQQWDATGTELTKDIVVGPRTHDEVTLPKM